MLTKFINPEGRVNEAELSVEQVERLKKTEGYTVIEPKKLRISISDEVCTSCQG
jgi:hypothetical protein